MCIVVCAQTQGSQQSSRVAINGKQSPPAGFTADALSVVSGDVRQAFIQPPSAGSGGGQWGGGVRALRGDLLTAADSVTSAMSFLVRELNSG
jgi:hypothetical protein